MPNTIGYIEEGKKRAKKNMDIELHGVWGRSTPTPLLPEVFTPAGWPACSTPVLRTLAGKPGAAKRALAELEGANVRSSFEGACLSLSTTPRSHSYLTTSPARDVQLYRCLCQHE